jgi:hypothetical protein
MMITAVSICHLSFIPPPFAINVKKLFNKSIIVG